MDKNTPEAAEGNEKTSELECPICLHPCIQPVQLPCSHIYCYLCVKGAIQQNNTCAMCRKTIPVNYLNNPHLINVEEPDLAFEGTYQWFYEGRNGWWRYDSRTSEEIEKAYKKNDTQCEVLIAGVQYIIDFKQNLQLRQDCSFRRRRIKRDSATIPIKGIAGIRAQNNENTSPCKGSGADCCSRSNSSSNASLQGKQVMRNSATISIKGLLESIIAGIRAQNNEITSPCNGTGKDCCSSSNSSSNASLQGKQTQRKQADLPDMCSAQQNAPGNHVSGPPIQPPACGPGAACPCFSHACPRGTPCSRTGPVGPPCSNSMISPSAAGWHGYPPFFGSHGHCCSSYSSWGCGLGYGRPCTGPLSPQCGHPGSGGYGCSGCSGACGCMSRAPQNLPAPDTVNILSGPNMDGSAATSPSPAATSTEKETDPPLPECDTAVDINNVGANYTVQSTDNTRNNCNNTQGTRTAGHCHRYNPY